jgi:transcriptional regulator with XRE-family HTH domain
VSIATEIKAARAKLGLSQSQAAKVWDVNLITLQSWEQGIRTPRGFALKMLQQILNAALSEANTPSASLGSPASSSTNTPPKPKLRPARKALILP